MVRLLLLLLMLVIGSPAAQASEFAVQTRWVMGTFLRIHLPSERDDLEALFVSCFETAEFWNDMLSPWQDAAPLTRLSRANGEWVDLPEEVMAYLERAIIDARRSRGAFDITLSREGSASIELDHERDRARLPRGLGPLDPGGDGKGVALDAMADLLKNAEITEALIDFGGSSYLARGSGPDGQGWQVALTGPGGELLGTLRLVDTALSVSSTVQVRRQEDGSVDERFHLADLATGDPVRVRRTAVVLTSSATEADVASTVVAITGDVELEGFPSGVIALFTDNSVEPEVRGEFARCFESMLNRQ